MDQVGAKLIACKPNFKFFYDNKDQLLNGFRSGELWAAAMWDTGGWTLNRENPDIQLRRAALRRTRLARYLRAAGARPQRSGGLCLDQLHHAPGECRAGHQIGRQFLRRPGHRTLRGPASQGSSSAAAFPEAELNNVHWYPAIPPGLEEIEGRVLDRIKAAN